MSLGEVVSLHLPLPPSASDDPAYGLSRRARTTCGNVVHLQVESVTPPSQGPLHVDPHNTKVLLKGGSCRLPPPVGVVVLSPEADGDSGLPLLGRDVTAPFHAHPGLEGVLGPLLPPWRSIARASSKGCPACVPLATTTCLLTSPPHLSRF
jgi:hypothetical protein